LKSRFFDRLSHGLAVIAGVLSCVAAMADEPFNCHTSVRTDNTVAVVSAQLAGVPAVLRIPKVITKPPIVLWHGFGPPASEQALMDALPLDELPAVKVYLGVPLFGARAPAGGVNELIRRQTEDFASLLFEPAVMGAAQELPAVLKSLQQRHCLKPHDRIGLFGFSAGGASVLMALAQRKTQVGAAVVINASTGLSSSIQAFERATKRPYSWTRHARQLAKSSDAVLHAAQIAGGNPPPALLLIHGTDDTTLTPKDAVALQEALLPYYRNTGNESRLQLTLEPGVSHDWSKADNIEGLRQTIAAWFARYS
jgi:predicted esterase